MNTDPTNERQRLMRAMVVRNTVKMVDAVTHEVESLDREEFIAGMAQGIVQASVAAAGASRTAAWLRALARRVEREAAASARLSRRRSPGG